MDIVPAETAPILSWVSFTTVAATVACIGPVTAEVARAHGLAVDVVADPHTIDGLVDALDAHFARATGAAGDASAGAP